MRKPNKNNRLIHCKYSKTGRDQWNGRSLSTCNYIFKSILNRYTYRRSFTYGGKSRLYRSKYGFYSVFSMTIDGASCSSCAGGNED